MVLIMV